MFDQFISEVIKHTELFVLGVLGVLTLLYLLALVHPVRDALLDYVENLRNMWAPKSGDSTVLKSINIAVLIGVLYYIGVLANSASYWLVTPLRLQIVSTAEALITNSICVAKKPIGAAPQSEASKPCRTIMPFPGDGRLPAFDAALIPIRHILSKQQTIQSGYETRNPDYILNEIKTENLKGDGRITSLLGTELASIRLLRGTALLSLLLLTACALKMALQMAFVLLWSWSDFWYDILIYWPKPEADGTASAIPRKWQDRVQTAWSRVLLPQSAILILSAAFYIAAIAAYYTTEFEYSQLVFASGQFPTAG